MRSATTGEGSGLGTPGDQAVKMFIFEQARARRFTRRIALTSAARGKSPARVAQAGDRLVLKRSRSEPYSRARHHQGRGRLANEALEEARPTSSGARCLSSNWKYKAHQPGDA